MSFLYRTWKEINTEALCNNFRIIQEQSGCKICAVIKADAYGHGAVETAKILEEKGADSFAVSNIQEAEELRTAGIKAPILILGYTPESCAEELAKLKITQCVYSFQYARALNEYAEKSNVKVDVHVKLDTGMGRLGFDCRDNDFCGIAEVRETFSLPCLSVSGVFTHFSSADSDDEDNIEFTKEQYNRFNEAVNELEAEGFAFKVRHCCNSAATDQCVVHHRFLNSLDIFTEPRYFPC